LETGGLVACLKRRFTGTHWHLALFGGFEHLPYFMLVSILFILASINVRLIFYTIVSAHGTLIADANQQASC
jgi:hypothetical protein